LIKLKNILKKYKRKTNIQIKIYFKCLFTSIFLNSNESLSYTLIKVIIHHLIKMTQRTNNKHNNKILT